MVANEREKNSSEEKTGTRAQHSRFLFQRNVIESIFAGDDDGGGGGSKNKTTQEKYGLLKS